MGSWSQGAPVRPEEAFSKKGASSARMVGAERVEDPKFWNRDETKRKASRRVR